MVPSVVYVKTNAIYAGVRIEFSSQCNYFTATPTQIPCIVGPNRYDPKTGKIGLTLSNTQQQTFLSAHKAQQQVMLSGVNLHHDEVVNIPNTLMAEISSTSWMKELLIEWNSYMAQPNGVDPGAPFSQLWDSLELSHADRNYRQICLGLLHDTLRVASNVYLLGAVFTPISELIGWVRTNDAVYDGSWTEL